MKIELNKNELNSALSALGKLVCRTSPVELYRCIQITGSNGTISFRTCSEGECILFSMEASLTDSLNLTVNFEEFRSAVRGCKTKTILIEDNADSVLIDGKVMTPVTAEFPAQKVPPEGTVSEHLPASFVEMLSMVAPLVNRNDYRKVLQGINLSRKGITATNGKELLNIPLSFEVENMTLPFPIALLATKVHEEGTLCCWTNGSDVFFEVKIGHWNWSGKALTGIYPNWQLIVPDRKNLQHSVTFKQEYAEKLKEWLKGIPTENPYTAVELSMTDRETLEVKSKDATLKISAEFGDDWKDYSLLLNKELLMRLLSEGHTRIECAENHSPFMATGGMGQYIAMPLYQPHTTQKTTESTTQKTTTETTTENNPINKEESTMNNEVKPVVSVPMQTVTRNTNNEPALEVNPLEELSANIEAFKGKLKAIFEESNALSRKVKEVALNQKQKERDFILAKRAIERIRMAI